ncbi:alcohol dehydrogenase [Thermogymnomonas acidicola]|uniref:Alcohol dehydrogenase n=1 Tax=Thermogymnomonas acidicola TaxID=399579 RepID=A0AA37BRQ4_9ARCH|nr:glucose 1-dehydrogenase [Thermogymnomonas acidicola]GGM72924.1 alcohol dehydrogenase [Thermogymnomonas acidicola]
MAQVNAILTDAPKGGVRYGKIDIRDEEGANAKLEPVYTGICGTDRGIVSGSLQFAYNPQGYSSLVLGHESVCKVIDIGENPYHIRPGDYVVPVVRRPGDCVNCLAGRQDNCSDGNKHEAGITGMHGFMREYFYDHSDYLVKVKDPSILDVAVLTEPTKNVMKAFEVFSVVSKRAIFHNRHSTLTDKRAFVIGTGSEAFLYALMCREYGFETVILNRHPIDERKLSLADAAGIEFHDYSKDFDQVTQGGIDLLIDTSGHPETIFRFMRKMNYNGVLILFGTNGKAPGAPLDGSDIDYIVERNITIAGSVDAAQVHYYQALEYIRKWRYVYGKAFASMITGVYSPEETDIFSRKPAEEIKSVIKW